MLNFILFIFPIIYGFLFISFFRNCVEDPRPPRIVWAFLLLFIIPILGLIMTVVSVIVLAAMAPDIELNKSSKFVQNWLLK